MKAIFFHDPSYFATGEEELEVLKDKLGEHNIEIPNLEETTDPPWDKKYDILFFDYGGISIGNNLLQLMCNDIIKIAKEHPSRLYIMVSDYTTAAMYEFEQSMKDDFPANIFMSIYHALPYLKRSRNETTRRNN